ncbi:alkaline shock response membrane anchor protein AmaP [Lactococcus ileimucosae]|uniref:alkaline shock response membrane anchor protein AmaP n=1 Tax=Lactococcus ileimucosae TaxID=2941329 RepID=UPI0035156C65
MSSGKKFICIVLDILLLSIVVPTAWDYYNLVKSNYKMSSSSQFLYIGEYVPAYLFWGNVVLALVLILALVITIFYPRTYIDITLSTQSGKLTLKRSTIEGLVREKVIENNYLKFPRIHVVLYKNRIEIYVKGEIIPRVEVTKKAQLLEQEIVDYLKVFFGLEQPLKIKVKVNAIEKKANSKHSLVV